MGKLDELKKLGELRDSGVLNEEEFNQEKKKLLADEDKLEQEDNTEITLDELEELRQNTSDSNSELWRDDIRALDSKKYRVFYCEKEEGHWKKTSIAIYGGKLSKYSMFKNEDNKLAEDCFIDVSQAIKIEFFSKHYECVMIRGKDSVLVLKFLSVKLKDKFIAEITKAVKPENIEDFKKIIITKDDPIKVFSLGWSVFWLIVVVVIISSFLFDDRETSSSSKSNSIDYSSANKGPFSDQQICKATVAATMFRDPSIIKVDSVQGGVTYLSYIRDEDKTEWKLRCKLQGGRVIWSTHDGRWRSGEYDSTIVFSVKGELLIIKEKFSGGSTNEKKFSLAQLL